VPDERNPTIERPTPLAESVGAVPPISIVIPCGPGESAWRGLLTTLEAAPFDHECILAGCEAAPADLPERPGLRWIEAPANRAAQLNAGIAAARHPQLWLLHADSRPSPSALHAAASPVDPGVLAWFPLRFEPARPAAVRLNALGANLRSRWLGLPFGDQGFRLQRETFDRLGGFDPAVRPGEDLDFAVRARAAGVRLQGLRTSLATSSRRYADVGWWRTTTRYVGLTWTLWRDSRRRLRR
jgi:hypothetical protein